MADLLTFLGQLQTRFAPFLANYHNFMQQDPEIPPDVSLNQFETFSFLKIFYFIIANTIHSIDA